MTHKSSPPAAEAYQSLSTVEQTILQVLSFFMVPLSRTALTMVLKNLGVRVVATRQIYPQDVSPLVAELLKKNLLVDNREGVCCHAGMRDSLRKALQQQGDGERYIEAITPLVANYKNYGGHHYYHSYQHLVQHVWLAILTRDEELLHRILTSSYKYHADDLNRQPPFALLFSEPLDHEFLLSLPTGMLAAILSDLCNRSISTMQPTSAFELLEQCIATRQDLSSGFLHLHLFFMIFRGRIREVAEKLESMPQQQFADLRALVKMLQGDDHAALPLFDEEIRQIKKATGKRKIFLPGYIGLFHLLALIRSDLPDHLAQAAELSAFALKQEGTHSRSVLWLLNQLAVFKNGVSRGRKELEQAVNSEYELPPFAQLIQSLVAVWLGKGVAELHDRKLGSLAKTAEQAGFLWIAAEAAMLRARLNPAGKHDTAAAEEFYTSQGMAPIAGNGGSQNDWERSLKALLAVGGGAPQGGVKTATAESRLVWQLAGDNKRGTSIQPLEQKRKGNVWSAGRNVALKRLADAKGNIDFMTPQDREIATAIKKHYSYYSQSCYEIDADKALAAMAGHPLVFNAVTGEQITVARGEFTLTVDRAAKQLTISMKPAIPADSAFFTVWEGTSRLILYQAGKEHRRIAAILGSGLKVPPEGEEKISAAIAAIAPFVTVHSAVAGESSNAETVTADRQLRIVLMPFEEGVMLTLQMRPLGDAGPSFPPGKGGAHIIAAVGGKSLQTGRDLTEEKTLCRELLEACPTLDLYPADNDGYWRIGNPEGTLELLEELHGATAGNNGAYVITWPEGEKLKLRGSAAWNSVRVGLRSSKEWFSIEGNVSIGDDLVVTLQHLLELSAQHKGRFIPLADGEFLALTEEFRRRLDELRRMVDRHGRENRFHPLAAPLVEEALYGVASLNGDRLWSATLERFKSAAELQPVLPSTFQATLRDYQLEGFAWLSRLAHWGVGACLADDMGLGKTIQALALLVSRAPDGPALVLAPTSVCLNWESECRHFAPTLNPRLFGGNNRRELIESLAPFDLVICSYTLFQQEAELLTAVAWHTAILDEAQAIKNMATKRSQAAMQLTAGFRIATTGTPVENRLDELWNLFRFLNPGLLGSHQSFSQRFAGPIERDGDKQTRTLLKKLIRPFMLRRTKNQVLQELPPRTDILQRVELSGEETALYEALRRKAVETLQEGGGQGEGERQIRILAEIMRLRRACCNPELVMPGGGLASSKLAAFREIVDELRENGHRALVFSQFVDHLALVRASLDKDKIGYQYLDGSTPQKNRQESVAAFQRGEGELFLISLKAGGVGLNLTAADYVIHLDPWWNPAVEDQASDRAHRIGQLRPVTVYRLVAANTIEEKIVALHHQKRDLADSLLEGADTAARVSADDLMDLLREVQ